MSHLGEPPYWGLREDLPLIYFVTCASCHKRVRPVAPMLDEDEVWAEVAKDHTEDCEWIRTRAWYRNEKWTEE